MTKLDQEYRYISEKAAVSSRWQSVKRTLEHSIRYFMIALEKAQSTLSTDIMSGNIPESDGSEMDGPIPNESLTILQALLLSGVTSYGKAFDHKSPMQIFLNPEKLEGFSDFSANHKELIDSRNLTVAHSATTFSALIVRFANSGFSMRVSAWDTMFPIEPHKIHEYVRHIEKLISQYVNIFIDENFQPLRREISSRIELESLKQGNLKFRADDSHIIEVYDDAYGARLAMGRYNEVAVWKDNNIRRRART